jgi:hypothetical protein
MKIMIIYSKKKNLVQFYQKSHKILIIIIEILEHNF